MGRFAIRTRIIEGMRATGYELKSEEDQYRGVLHFKGTD
jgi:hypothetical protein